MAAGAAEARLLELRRGAPLLAVARTAWDADGRAFERSHDLFRADRARMRGPILATAGTRWLNLESRRTTSSARDRVEEKGTHGHHQAGPRGRSARHEGTVESVYAGDSGVDRLKPNAIGLWGVIFVGVTGAAPISAMLFNVPFATGFGTGLYTPAAFLFATIILTIFTIGYVAMARKMRAAGGFYTFISHGLGRELGLAAGITGAIAYSLFEVSLLGGFAYFASTNFNDWFGWDIPWIAFALFAAVLISVLCYFHVELSVKVLGVALVSEVIILAIFDLVVFGQGGSNADGIQFESLNMFKLTDPGPGLAAGVGLFLAFWSWVGFEAIPNYAEESKNPKRIIPRATLISVVALGIGYVITSLAFVSAFPENDAGQGRAATPNNPPFFLAMRAVRRTCSSRTSCRC